MANLMDIEMINSSVFDYTQLDKKVAEELQEIAINISATANNMKYIIGKKLNEAQELLSKNGYGCFGEWIESNGLKKRTAYNFINFYKVFVQNLHEQEKLKELSDSKIYELGKLDANKQDNILKNINLKEMSTKEVKELTKQLKEEQEYSEELQEAIKSKEEQIRKLQNQIENILKPEVQVIEKEVVKEIIPERLIEEKKRLQSELKDLQERAEKAEDALKSVKLESKVEKDNLYYKNNLDLLQVIVKEFLGKASKYTYFKEEYQDIPVQKKKFIENNIEQVKNWVMLMEQALDNRQDVVGNIIYGEGEIIDE